MKTKWGYFAFCLAMAGLISVGPTIGGLGIGPGLLVSACILLVIVVIERAVISDARKQRVDRAERGASQNDPQSIFKLGVAYESGSGVEQSDAVAAGHYQRAAEMGHKGAMYEYALCLRDGRGIEQDVAEARKILTLLSCDGDEAAQHVLEELAADFEP